VVQIHWVQDPKMMMVTMVTMMTRIRKNPFLNLRREVLSEF